MDGPHVRQPKGRREEPLVIQGGSSPKTRATCPLGEFGGWNGWKPHGLLLLNMISFLPCAFTKLPDTCRHLPWRVLAPSMANACACASGDNATAVQAGRHLEFGVGAWGLAHLCPPDISDPSPSTPHPSLSLTPRPRPKTHTAPCVFQDRWSLQAPAFPSSTGHLQGHIRARDVCRGPGPVWDDCRDRMRSVTHRSGTRHPTHLKDSGAMCLECPGPSQYDMRALSHSSCCCDLSWNRQRFWRTAPLIMSSWTCRLQKDSES